MASPKVNVLPPIGNGMNGYDRTKRHTDQPMEVPSVFIDCMKVREAIFVDQQNCRLETEFDDEDARSYQWTVHAVPPSGKAEDGEPTTTRALAGTLRLVPPYIHAEHPPEPDHKPTDEALENQASTSLPLRPAPPSLNPDNEPYFKLGRLAFLPGFRGSGLAKLLIDISLGYIAQNPTAVVAKEFRPGEAGPQGEWKGLVLTHAQRPIEKLYKKWGFETDEAMGVWDEEGIEHVGMWRRLELKKGNLTDPQAKEEEDEAK